MNNYRLLFLMLFVMIFSSSSCDVKKEGGKSALSVTPDKMSFTRSGGAKALTLASTSDWTASAPQWIQVTPSKGKGQSNVKTLQVSAEPDEDTDRSGEIVISTASGATAKVAVTQEGKIAGKEDESGEGGNVSLKGKKFLVIANSMVYYGGFVQKGNAGKDDPGMFFKLLKAKGMEGTVIDCTQGGHYLSDYLSTCHTCAEDGKTGVNHLSGQDFKSFDYVILSEAGTNTKTFLSDCRALYKKVTDVNPNAKKVYINHIYSVYKNHSIILGNLKTLHEQDGVTIVNCGQLAYDIYTGKVRVPGGSLSYSDRYTFCNHTSSDTHHPNPLMGYIMTQMAFCALTGESADYADYKTLIKSCSFAGGSVSYDAYYNKYYTTPASMPFMTVIDNDAEMKGIQQLIPQYINKF